MSRTQFGVVVLVLATTGSAAAATWNLERTGVRTSVRDANHASVVDTFPHARHEKLSCLACHATGTGHGRLTFEPPRGCAACHHREPESARCATCHRANEYGAPRPATVIVTVDDRQPRARPVEFLHSFHLTRTCVECHTTPVTLAPAAEKAQCQDCHNEHHAARRGCASCHAGAAPRAAHTLEVAHQRCDACHATATITQLTPARGLCGACHVEQVKDHHVEKECSTCHFLADPAAYRSKLVTPATR